MESLHIILQTACLIGLVAIAYRDFLTLKIPNLDVLLFLALVLATLAAGGFDNILADLAAGLVLFILGFVFWLFRMMGAGDAKLYLPLGLLVGWDGLAMFGLLLLPVSVVFLVVLRVAGARATGQGKISTRLREIFDSRMLPYAVPMAIAAIVTVLFRLV